MRQDKRTYIKNSVDKDLDVRDRWLGIKQMKRGFRAQPYIRKDKDGNVVNFQKQAEAAADYLEQVQWKEPVARAKIEQA